MKLQARRGLVPLKQLNGGTLAFICGWEIVLGDAEGFLTGRRTKALQAAPSSEAVAWISSSWCLSCQGRNLPVGTELWAEWTLDFPGNSSLEFTYTLQAYRMLFVRVHWSFLFPSCFPWTSWPQSKNSRWKSCILRIINDLSCPGLQKLQFLFSFQTYPISWCRIYLLQHEKEGRGWGEREVVCEAQ